MRRLALLAAAVATTVAATACRTTIPELFPLPADDPRPARLLEAWTRTAEERHALRGRAKLSVDGGDGDVRLRGRQVVVLERPARLRVEIQGLLNQTVAVIVTDGQRYELLRAGDRSYESGDVHPHLLWEHAWLALTPEQAIDLLLGAPPPDPALAPARAWADAQGRVTLELVDGALQVRQRASFDPAARLRSLEVRGSDGRLAWRAEFDEYAPIGDIAFAHAVDVEVTAGRSRAEIRLRDVELNPELPPGIFQLRPPESGAAASDGQH